MRGLYQGAWKKVTEFLTHISYKLCGRKIEFQQKFWSIAIKLLNFDFQRLNASRRQARRVPWCPERQERNESFQPAKNKLSWFACLFTKVRNNFKYFSSLVKLPAFIRQMNLKSCPWPKAREFSMFVFIWSFLLIYFPLKLLYVWVSTGNGIFVTNA